MGSNRIVALIGRCLVAVPFLVFGFTKIEQFHGIVGMMGSMKIPAPTVATVIIIIIEVLGGICLVLGFRARFWAWLMFLYLIPVTFMVHNYWTYAAPQRADEIVHFYKNIGIMGGLLMIAAFGAGSASVDKA
jgi:putative oxidoreductase